MEFAAESFGTRLVVVMGHTHCGAIRATIDALEEDSAPQSSNVQSIVDRITPHVRHLFAGPGDHQSRLDAAVHCNAIAAANELRGSSPLLRNLVDHGRVVIVAAVYDLETGVVTFLDQ